MKDKIETCENCGRKIGKLEPSHIYRNMPVCGDCIVKLTGRMTMHAAKRMEPPKNYNGAALITLALYFFGFWIIGVIANSIYLSSSHTEKMRTGRNPEGRGCLLALAWFFVGGPIAIGLFFALVQIVRIVFS